MATIEQLHPSILTLNPIEQLELIKKTRLSRRTPKLSKKKKTAVKVQAKKTAKKLKTTATPKQLFDLMSTADKAAILKELLGG